MTFIYFSSLIIFILLCILLCFVILLQESKSMGMGASFGGDSSDSLFGTATADILKKFTAWLAFAFLIACVFLSSWTAAMGRVTTKSATVAIEESITLPE